MLDIRNIAIIAHVDHGKTTLVDRMLHQVNMFRDNQEVGELILDSNDLERERGITILSKNVSVRNKDVKIIIIDTPWHADYGGEVERVLKMADGVLLLVDAFEGPMPQTRFVLSKALAHKLRPVVIVNKVDLPDARPNEGVDEVFDLLVQLDADDTALDFPVIYASAKNGWATTSLENRVNNMQPVFDAIIDHIPYPKVSIDVPVQMLVTSLEYSEYVGRIAIGRIFAGRLCQGQAVTVIDNQGLHTQQKIMQLHKFRGLGKEQADSIEAGDICAVSGLDPIDIGNTIACPDKPSSLPIVTIDEPTMHITFRVNDGPFAGKDGKSVTSRNIKERLDKELQHNVALRVEQGQTPEEFVVSGRGLMHLGILLENMRREGFELCAGKPNVIIRKIDGLRQEPIELLVIDCPIECQSAVMSLLGNRRSEMVSMDAKSGASGFLHMEFKIPSRGIFGLHSRMLNATQGRAIMHHIFDRYELMKGAVPQRQNGVIIATHTGQVTAYALDSLYDRGLFFVKPGEQVYEGRIVGEHCKENDITANVAKAKQLSNVRASGKDDAAKVRPVRQMSLEAALEYIQDDELVEICPNSIRLRKRILQEGERRRATKGRT